MDIKINQIPKTEKEKITIECHKIDSKIDDIVKFIQSRQGTISGNSDNRQYEINITDIFYIESVDDRTFIYSEKNVYETRQRLYELENLLSDKSFLRISKSVIVNLMKIISIKPALNGRFITVLSNNTQAIISRKYVPILKEKIKGAKN